MIAEDNLPKCLGLVANDRKPIKAVFRIRYETHHVGRKNPAQECQGTRTPTDCLLGFRIESENGNPVARCSFANKNAGKLLASPPSDNRHLSCVLTGSKT